MLEFQRAKFFPWQMTISYHFKFFHNRKNHHFKSDNLQYNTLRVLRWVPGLIVSSTKHLMSKYYFDRLKIKQWVAGLDLEHSKLIIFFSVRKVIKKNKLKGFLKRIWQEIRNKIMPGTSDAWWIRQLFRRPSKLYWRLSDFWICGYLTYF